MEEIIEKIGLLKDKVENLCFSIKMQLPANIHVEGMRGELPDMLEQLEHILGLFEKEGYECN